MNSYKLLSESRDLEQADAYTESRLIDRRTQRRCQALALLTIKHGGDRSSAGMMYNLSGYGMFVLSRARVHVNECLDIMVRLSDMNELYLRIPAMVIHTCKQGFGVMFRGHDEPSCAAVKKLCLVFLGEDRSRTC